MSGHSLSTAGACAGFVDDPHALALVSGVGAPMMCLAVSFMSVSLALTSVTFPAATSLLVDDHFGDACIGLDLLSGAWFLCCFGSWGHMSGFSWSGGFPFLVSHHFGMTLFGLILKFR